MSVEHADENYYFSFMCVFVLHPIPTTLKWVLSNSNTAKWLSELNSNDESNDEYIDKSLTININITFWARHISSKSHDIILIEIQNVFVCSNRIDVFYVKLCCVTKQMQFKTYALHFGRFPLPFGLWLAHSHDYPHAIRLSLCKQYFKSWQNVDWTMNRTKINVCLCAATRDEANSKRKPHKKQHDRSFSLF